MITTSSDPTADTILATLPETGAEASIEWTARVNLEVLKALVAKKQSTNVGTEMTLAALLNDVVENTAVGEDVTMTQEQLSDRCRNSHRKR